MGYQLLKKLLEKYNDGKSKGLYCITVNLFPISELDMLMDDINTKTIGLDIKSSPKEAAKLIKERAESLKIDLKLRN